MVILYLTCASEAEAKKISTALLEAKLVACARLQPISSSYWWDGEIAHSDEVLLMMESQSEKFEAIEQLVAKLHSYDTFVLTAVPVEKSSNGVEQWLSDSLS